MVIVMGTQGLGGVRKWLLGSTTEHVLRRTATPVLAIPGAVSDSASADVDALPPAGHPLLAATDFSEASIDALAWARDLAQALASPLLLVHAVEPVEVTRRWQPYLEQAHRERVAEAEARLQRLFEQFAGSVEAECVVETRPAAEAIASIAERRRPRAIVMGLGGGGHGTRPGSIAYRVLCLAGVPVLVVPRRSVE